MATINLGKIGFSWKGAYVPASTYYANDVVSYNGSTYIAKSTTTGYSPDATSKWDKFADGAKDVASTAGDLVYHNGTTLTALHSGTAGNALVMDTNNLPTWSAVPSRSGTRVKSLPCRIQDKDGNWHNKHTSTYRRGGTLMVDGTIRMWGRGENWMHGAGNQTQDRSYPVTAGFPPNSAPIERFWMGHDYWSAAIDEDGKFWAWGQNDHGEVGRGNTSDTHIPYCASDNSTNSIYGKTVIDLAPSVNTENSIQHIVLTSDGKVHSCGYNGNGTLGMGDTTNRSNFNEVPVLSDIVKIAKGRSGAGHVLALKNDGTVYSWGYNRYGQLGNGNTTQGNIPMPISYFTANQIVIVDIGCGREHSWAISDTGTLYTWGYNGYGNLGRNGTSTNSVTYTPDSALTGVKWVATSGNDYEYMMAIKEDGTLWATGDNSYGCLGVAADTTDRSTFQQCKKYNSSTPMEGIVDVICGGNGSYNYTYALDEDGVAWSVGYSGNGQLGRGTYDGTNYWFHPVLIPQKRVTQIWTHGTGSEGGAEFLLEDGTVMDCGYAGESQLPEDDDETISVPMQVIF